MTELRKHPVSFIKDFSKSIPEASLEFSKYISGGRGVTTRRTIFQVKISELNRDWFAKIQNDLEAGEELAIHSRTIINGHVFHIPLIDFLLPPDQIPFDEVKIKIKAKYNCNLVFYASGRSVHAYMDKMLNEAEWNEFLGFCLLLNPFDQLKAPIVDCRWIGHSLEQGFSALRWSVNTPQYLQMPQLLHTNKLKLKTSA